ncbi:uncharacterized, partial [Tachysurus ichikawai]
MSRRKQSNPRQIK